MEHITITIYSDDPHLPPLVLVRDDAQHEGFGVADDGAESRGAVDCLASLDIWLATKYLPRQLCTCTLQKPRDWPQYRSRAVWVLPSSLPPGMRT